MCNKPVTKREILYDLRYLEESNSQRYKVEFWLPGPGKREVEEESVSERCDVRKTQPAIAGSEGERRPQTKECRQPVAAHGKENRVSLRVSSKECSPLTL